MSTHLHRELHKHDPHSPYYKFEERDHDQEFSLARVRIEWIAIALLVILATWVLV